MNGTPKPERRLKLACEISAEHVVAGRASQQGDVLETCTVRSLPSGAVVPGLTNDNVPNAGALKSVLSDALATIGDSHRDIVAVIPDAACRVTLLDFDSLPSKPAEADAVVRFRLKKALPFDVDRAVLSYDVRQNGAGVRVVAAVSPPGVIEEYESAFRSAGYVPGFVVPSTLASLGIVDASSPTLVVKIAAGITTIAIVNNDDLVLYRTTDNPSGEALDPEQIADDAYPSLIFFQDTYGLQIERILVGGTGSFDLVSRALESCTGVHPQELVPQYALSSAAVGSAQRPFVAGIMGALIS